MPFKNRAFWIFALIGLALDQVTKYWIVQSFELGQSVPLWEGVFHLTFVTNKGAAFSLFSGGVWWLRWLSLIVSLALMALAVFGPKMAKWEEAGYGFILSGALGNGLDRFLAGEVVDFLDFRLIRFPVFNLADVFINVGIICLLISLFVTPKRPNGNGEESIS
ncbi:lipoprotein signal peptidase [Oscillatoria sp. FACHB-1407]|uniref:signal peptidase II n=1 Tax=Oscillatoria sp. FACHB-1407 TaxID=2692847 RepID=UPI0016870BC7|nr:signal peptidase II [Oscillatoria sp. FACHB-1407]MBD2461968.1 lipoprotein signal peptidase [Oscillatoria sp. FACHB-1407]